MVGLRIFYPSASAASSACTREANLRAQNQQSPSGGGCEATLCESTLCRTRMISVTMAMAAQELVVPATLAPTASWLGRVGAPPRSFSTGRINLVKCGCRHGLSGCFGLVRGGSPLEQRISSCQVLTSFVDRARESSSQLLLRCHRPEQARSSFVCAQERPAHTTTVTIATD